MSSSYYNCLTQIDFDSEYTPIFFDIGFIQVEYGGTYDDAEITVDDIIKYLEQFNYKEYYRTHEELLFTHEEELK